jgi:hypothetical protein
MIKNGKHNKTNKNRINNILTPHKYSRNAAEFKKKDDKTRTDVNLKCRYN